MISPCFFATTGGLLAQKVKNPWLEQVKMEIKKTALYDNTKWNRIFQRHLQPPGKNDRERFDHYEVLYNEFALFNFDSAYFYAQKMEETAGLLNDRQLQNWSALKEIAVLLASGLFKEVFESLNRLTPAGFSPEGKLEYYRLKARSYFDLADYNHDKTFSVEYDSLAEQSLDSLLHLAEAGSFTNLYYNGLKHIRDGRVNQAAVYFRQLLADTTLTLPQQAVVHSTVSDLYTRKGQVDSALIFLAKAAIADIQSSTKETTAVLHLASHLYREGDVQQAAPFIRKAAADARFYGARQRLAQQSAIQSLIESEQLSVMQKEKSGIVLYAIIISSLVLFFSILFVVIIRQVKKLKRQQKEIQQKNSSLQQLVEEKEWLLKEVHHRVKNNLHTINSLLESQSRYLNDEALQAVKNSQRRIFAMSLIHQKLYQPKMAETTIDMAIYLQELVHYLEDSFEVGQRVRFYLKLAPIQLDIYLAIPLGLILNEVITNALKYAFPGENNGAINITLRQENDTQCLLVVSDNGKGLGPDFDAASSSSLGMKLIKGLSDEIGASLRLETGEGTSISLIFSAGAGKEMHQAVSS